MTKNKVVQAATMKLEVELRCSECNSPLIVNNTWSDVHGLSCYVEPCEECMSRRTQRAPDVCPECAGSGKTGSIGLPRECPYCDGTGTRR